MVIRTSEGEVTTIDFREKAPSGASKDMFLDDSLNVIPEKVGQHLWLRAYQVL